MTLDKAEQIVERAATAASRQPAPSFRRLSELGGYSFSEIEIALKLCVARDFLLCANDTSASAMFQKNVNGYDVLNLTLPSVFFPDDQADKLERLKPGSEEFDVQKMLIVAACWDQANPEYQRRRQSETIPSFANYCRHVGAKDALYWQKVYTHLGLDYGPSSPRGNPVTRFDVSGAPTPRVQNSNEVSSSKSGGCASCILAILVAGLFFITIAAFP